MKSRLLDATRGWWPARRHYRPGPEHERILSGTRLEQHGALTAMYLTGSAYEMGYQHGVLARDLIHGFRRAAYAYVAPQIPAPHWLARPVLFHHTAAYWSTIPAQLSDEMRGIADGAGVHPVEVLLSTAIWEIFHAHGCSQFASIKHSHGPSGLIHGYNYDLMDPRHALIQPHLALIFYRPDQGIPFVTLNTGGSVGVNGGMNEAGISVAWDNTYVVDPAPAGEFATPVVPFIVTLRRVLQYAHTIDEAIRMVLDSLPRPLADIIIVGSSQERMAVALETVGHRHALRQMDEGTIWSTNCFRSHQLARYDRRGDGGDLSMGERWHRFPRYSAYQELFRDLAQPLTPEGAAVFLRDPYPREAMGYRHPAASLGSTICRDITSWSLIMEPGRGRIWASDAIIPGCQNRFYAFDLKAWRPLPALDIPATGYGAAVQSAHAFLAGDTRASQAALEEAFDRDGTSAPLHLMRALLAGLAGDAQRAAGELRTVTGRWRATPAANLAEAWLSDDAAQDVEPIPFPSAIYPALLLGPAARWQDRAVRGLPNPRGRT